MSNYLSRKKTLMGKRFEIEVPLEQYGGAIVRVHAIPDMELARIEDRTGYKLEDAIAALSSQGLTDEEVASLQAGPLSPELAQKVSVTLTEDELGIVRSGDPSPKLIAKLTKSFTPEEIAIIKVEPPTPDLTAKASKALSPKLTLFLGELCKAGIVPDPGCSCKGKGCQDCDVSLMVEEFRGFSVLMIGMAIIGASTASWKDVEAFFSAQRGPSGVE